MKVIAPLPVCLLLAIGSGASGGEAASVAPLQPTLKVGDPAPSLGGLTWIKGEPVPAFQSGHVYVVEFWATWCAPCNAIMPQLSSLQEKYAGSVTVIGVNVREKEAERTVDAVRAFVDKKGARMAYTVAMDDPVREQVYKDWMVAGGISGIPASFVIDRNATLVWIGHPTSSSAQFHTAVEQALNGASDLAAARALQAEVNQNSAQSQRKSRLLKPMREAMDAKDYPRAVAEADRIAAAAPDLRAKTVWTKLSALWHVSESDALSFAAAVAQDPAYAETGERTPARFWTGIGISIAQEDGLSADLYRRARGYLQAGLADDPDLASAWLALSKVESRLGDRTGAIAAQEKAIAAGRRTGFTHETVASWQAVLESLKDH